MAVASTYLPQRRRNDRQWLGVTQQSAGSHTSHPSPAGSICTRAGVQVHVPRSNSYSSSLPFSACLSTAQNGRAEPGTLRALTAILANLQQRKDKGMAEKAEDCCLAHVQGRPELEMEYSLGTSLWPGCTRLCLHLILLCKLHEDD